MKKQTDKAPASKATRSSAKASAKKRAMPQVQKQVRTTNYWTASIIILLLVILAAFAIYSLLQKAPVEGTVATINGKPLTAEQIDFQYALLPASYRESFTREQIIEQIIEEELVVQAAEREGFIVTPQDINERVQKIIAQNGISIADLQENLVMLNVTQESFEKLISRQILIERYVNTTIKDPIFDEETLEEVYNASKVRYVVGEQATVRHILIASQRDDAALLAKRVYDLARNGTNFCTLAANFSDDRGSRDKCGEYTFPKGFMVKEFEQAAFTMQNNEYRLIQTQFGYHVMNKVASIPASVKPFSEVRSSLAIELVSADRARQYRTMVAQLRNKATIIYANGTKMMPQQPSAMGAPPQAEANDVAATAQVVKVTVPDAINTQEEVAAVPVESNKEDAAARLTCIAGKVTVYGTTWNTDTQTAIKEFANQKVLLPSVMCDNEPKTCSNKGIRAYPTWIIGKDTILGRMTLEELQQATGC